MGSSQTICIAIAQYTLVLIIQLPIEIHKIYERLDAGSYLKGNGRNSRPELQATVIHGSRSGRVFNLLGDCRWTSKHKFGL